MDVIGEAISRALIAFKKAPTPTAGYTTIASLLQDVGSGLRPATNDELWEVVRSHTGFPGPPNRSFDLDVDGPTALDVVVALVDWMLRYKGLYADEESIRTAARSVMQQRSWNWPMTGSALSWEEISAAFGVNEDDDNE
jgi:hypothetical protein